MSNLILAARQLADLEQMLIESDGEITDDIKPLMQIDFKVPDLIDQEYLRLEKIDAAIEFYAKQSEKFSRIASALNNFKSFKKSEIKNFLIESGQDQIVGQDYVFKLSGSAPSVDVNEAELDDAYFRVKREPDKKKIADDLKIGIPVKGAILKETKSLRMGINRGGK